MLPLLRGPAVRRFLRYTVVGVSTFLVDLALLHLLTEYTEVPRQVAIPLAFFVAVSINYAISRLKVFRGTTRRVHHGYAYFIGIASIGAFITLGLTEFFTVFVGEDQVLLARTLTAGVVGVGNYLTNLYFNFKVVGHHP